MSSTKIRKDIYLSHAADFAPLHNRDYIPRYYKFETRPLWGSNWNLNPNFIETLRVFELCLR
jgi:hypothetical protein